MTSAAFVILMFLKAVLHQTTAIPKSTINQLVSITSLLAHPFASIMSASGKRKSDGTAVSKATANRPIPLPTFDMRRVRTLNDAKVLANSVSVLGKQKLNACTHTVGQGR